MGAGLSHGTSPHKAQLPFDPGAVTSRGAVATPSAAMARNGKIATMVSRFQIGDNTNIRNNTYYATYVFVIELMGAAADLQFTMSYCFVHLHLIVCIVY
jgi:hypothetical protein